MTDEDLQDRIKNSPPLRALQNQLQSEIVFRAPKEATFDPILVVTIISIIVQVIIHCRKSQDEPAVRAAMRDFRALPFRQQFRLRRELRKLWRENCPAGGDVDDNPLIEAVYQLSDSADDAAIDELLWLAEKHDQ